MSGTAPACPCGTFEFPQPICNLSGLSAISYRVGDFVAFRYQLLEPLPSETELTAWRPGAQGDLGMQMVEWWAYLADILTFDNERIANETYLDTAALPESVNHLVQLLGYRPKPALGAKGTLAALLSPSARLPLTVPAGLQIQSKPGPGQQPQIFQVDQATTIGTPDLVIADVVPANQPLLDRTNSTLWLAGKVTGIKAGDRLFAEQRIGGDLANRQGLPVDQRHRHHAGERPARQPGRTGSLHRCIRNARRSTAGSEICVAAESAVLPALGIPEFASGDH
jgi:hypothetical protein